jgi:hypothetical protein
LVQVVRAAQVAVVIQEVAVVVAEVIKAATLLEDKKQVQFNDWGQIRLAPQSFQIKTER